MKTRVLAVCIVLLFAPASDAQQKLAPNQIAARQISAGATDTYSISLNDGDYVGGSIGQHGRVNISIRNPDGSVMLRLLGSPGDAKSPFKFIAEGAGVYSISITNSGEQAASYELLLEKIVSLDERLRPEAWSDPNPSPRIQALRSQIASGQTNTESFWKQVAERGTPLIEPLDDKYRLVTFLWRARHDTRNVFVRGPFTVPGPTPNKTMHQIGDSDVWYLTLKLPKGSRFTYQVVPNKSPNENGPQAIPEVDPFNPRHWDCGPDASKYECESVAELPDALPQPWIVSKPGTPNGRIEKQRIKSAIQKVERGLFVYTPAGYKSDGPPNDLLILFDGDDYLSPDWKGQTTLDNLIAAHRIPPTVTVMVDNLPKRRLVDLVANPEFADFLATELVPWIRTHYNVRRESARTVVGGFSAGGLAATYIGLRHSEVFGNVLSMSGAFWWSPEHHGGVCGAKCPEFGGRRANPGLDATTEPNWMAQQFVTTSKLPVRFYLAVGTFEIDKEGVGGAILESTRTLRDVLRTKGYEVRYQQFDGGHDVLVWRGMFADGLIALLGRR